MTKLDDERDLSMEIYKRTSAAFEAMIRGAAADLIAEDEADYARRAAAVLLALTDNLASVAKAFDLTLNCKATIRDRFLARIDAPIPDAEGYLTKSGSTIN